ncbi:putative cytochrome 82A3-like [Capsicum annuum]|nr:putative cytochrome 82A3-like [Capsicum annuum]KAF3673613.1 putative cytochrome 82A3-like [Capsicum annuum]
MAFANGPTNIASEMLCYNNAMFAFGHYGPYWREMRKIVTIEFLSAQRIHMFGHIRVLEVKSVVKEIYDYWLKNKSSNLNGAVKMELKEWFGNLIINTMVKMLFGVQYTAKRWSRKVPEVGRAWLIIGHLHLLNGSQMPHKIFGHMADKYGPIFRLKLGVNQVVIVSDHIIARECFTTNDMAFANRPKSIASEILGYNYAMFGLGP